jgi:hypothetical protein
MAHINDSHCRSRILSLQFISQSFFHPHKSNEKMSRKGSTAKSALSVEEIEFDAGDRQQHFYIDPVAERKLIRKLDWKLIPWLCLLYLISFLDRTNIGNAAILGLFFKLPFIYVI